MCMGQDVYKGKPTDQILVDEAMVAYCRELTRIVSSISAQVKAALPMPLKGGERTHLFQPGDWDLVHAGEAPIRCYSLHATAVKVKERTTWVHAFHCKKEPIS